MAVNEWTYHAQKDVWSFTAGRRGEFVEARERVDRRREVWLFWNIHGLRSGAKLLGPEGSVFLRNSRGNLHREVAASAENAARAKLAELIALASGSVVAAPRTSREREARLPFAATESLVFDPDTGKYPALTEHGKEVRASLRFAVAYYGKDRTWESVTSADIRALGRARIRDVLAKGGAGYRQADKALEHMVAIANWLRDNGKIPMGAFPASRNRTSELQEDWRTITGAGRDYETNANDLRYTTEEYGALLIASPQVDKRAGLLLELGGGQRLGQVARCRMTDYNPFRAVLKVPGAGKKKTSPVRLTRSQARALTEAITTGYLRLFEARFQETGEDYWLFPSGYMPGSTRGEKSNSRAMRPENPETRKPITKGGWSKWLRRIELEAGVVHVPGRLAHGVRRTETDEMLDDGATVNVVQAGGGWTDPITPMRLYAAKQRERDAQEAAERRERFRRRAKQAARKGTRGVA